MQNNQNNKLIAAILIAAVIIGASLVYLGSRFTAAQKAPDQENVNLEAAIEKGIEDFIKKQQAGETGGSETAVRNASEVASDIEDDDAFLGENDAAVSIIEFSDYECPFCKRNFTQTYPLIKEKYVNSGKAKLVFRDYPLDFHDPLATEEAMAAECVRAQADDEKYFAYHDLIFQTTSSNGRGMEKSQLYELAKQSGVDQGKFTSCLDDEKFKQEIAGDIADGQQAGVAGTPGFIILAKKDESKIDTLKALEVIQQGQYINQYIETADGKRMGMRVSGAQPFTVFESIIEVLLN